MLHACMYHTLQHDKPILICLQQQQVGSRRCKGALVPEENDCYCRWMFLLHKQVSFLSWEIKGAYQAEDLLVLRRAFLSRAIWIFKCTL